MSSERVKKGAGSKYNFTKEQLKKIHQDVIRGELYSVIEAKHHINEQTVKKIPKELISAYCRFLIIKVDEAKGLPEGGFFAAKYGVTMDELEVFKAKYAVAIQDCLHERADWYKGDSATFRRSSIAWPREWIEELIEQRAEGIKESTDAINECISWRRQYVDDQSKKEPALDKVKKNLEMYRFHVAKREMEEAHLKILIERQKALINKYK